MCIVPLSWYRSPEHTIPRRKMALKKEQNQVKAGECEAAKPKKNCNRFIFLPFIYTIYISSVLCLLYTQPILLICLCFWLSLLLLVLLPVLFLVILYRLVQQKCENITHMGAVMGRRLFRIVCVCMRFKMYQMESAVVVGTVVGSQNVWCFMSFGFGYIT